MLVRLRGKAQTQEAGQTSSKSRFAKVVRFGDSDYARVAVVQPADLRDRDHFRPLKSICKAS
jgi:hypothetical protein